MTTKYLVVNVNMLEDNSTAIAWGDCNVYAVADDFNVAQECVKERVDNGSAGWEDLIIVPFSKYYEAKPVDPEWAIKTVK